MMINLTRVDQPITRNEVKSRVFEIHEFVEYLRYLASIYPDCPLTAEKVYALYEQGVRDGVYWTEVTEDLNLPEPEWA
jgi:hypothetical protein